MVGMSAFEGRTQAPLCSFPAAKSTEPRDRRLGRDPPVFNVRLDPLPPTGGKLLTLPPLSNISTSVTAESATLMIPALLSNTTKIAVWASYAMFTGAATGVRGLLEASAEATRL